MYMRERSVVHTAGRLLLTILAVWGLTSAAWGIQWGTPPPPANLGRAVRAMTTPVPERSSAMDPGPTAAATKDPNP
jgi:hypothetical protein